MLAWFKALSPLMRRFRLSRIRRIKRFFPDLDDRSIVDIGGSLHFWELVRSEIRPRQVTIYNIALDAQFDANDLGRGENNVSAMVYDGKHIPADDKEVDLLICNSVIEHVPVGERPALAREITRVARNYVIQTPAKLFPIEPHFIMPFLHWMPRSLGRSLVRISPFGLVHRDRNLTQNFFDEINILTADEFQRLFPDGELIVEHFLFIPKSYMIISRMA